jgi:hypothetical protein
MLKLTMIVLISVLLSVGCTEDLEKQLAAKDQQIAALKNRVEELENGEQNLFNECVTAYKAMTGNMDLLVGLQKVQIAIEKCRVAGQKYPGGLYADKIKTYPAPPGLDDAGLPAQRVSHCWRGATAL